MRSSKELPRLYYDRGERGLYGRWQRLPFSVAAPIGIVPFKSELSPFGRMEGNSYWRFAGSGMTKQQRGDSSVFTSPVCISGMRRRAAEADSPGRTIPAGG